MITYQQQQQQQQNILFDFIHSICEILLIKLEFKKTKVIMMH